MSASNSSLPAASILDQWRGFRRIDRCTRRSASGTGGRPPGFFGFSMQAVYVMQKCVDKARFA